MAVAASASVAFGGAEEPREAVRAVVRERDADTDGEEHGRNERCESSHLVPP